MLRLYPQGLRSSYLIPRLLEEGWTEKQIGGARRAVCVVRGLGRHATWSLRFNEPELDEAPDTPPRPTPAPAPRRRVCVECGIAIGRRAQGEPELCLRHQRKEAA